MTTSQAGQRLGLARSTIIEHCRNGLIIATKPGRDWWIEPAEVERYSRERRPRGNPGKRQAPQEEGNP